MRRYEQETEAPEETATITAKLNTATSRKQTNDLSID
jgi:hypothetical protein